MLIDLLKVSQSRIDGSITEEIIETKEVDEEEYLRSLFKMIISAMKNDV